ncbi:MAG TPA: extracellular solute-binding protein [Chloroflexota bacterium]|jgi:putative aldouronate transport system substrate-binding protein
MATNDLTFSRRRLIITAAGGAALPLLAACSAVVPAAPTAPPSGSAGATTKPASALPSFIANTTGPKPDFPAAGPQYQDGFINYPKNPAKALPSTPPGAGGKVLCYTNNSAPAPPTPFEQNQAWQETNKQLNADVSFTIIAQSDYLTKLATVMAGNDLPDVMLIPGNTNSGAAQVQSLTQFLQAKAADLTPYLAGDAAKDYPNLAAIPTYSWVNSACARGGKLYMLPIERYYPGSMLLKNSAVYDAALGKDYVPKNADDFKRVLQQLNRPSDNQWAIGAYQNQMYYIYYFAAMFGSPNNWSLDANGKLTRDIETPQYKEAVGYVRDLIASGLYHPDALTIADSTRARDAFIGSKFVLDVETFGNAWQDAWTRGPKLNPPVTPQAVLPFAAHDGGKAQHFLGKGYFGTTAFKSAPPDRVKELLRIANWLAAPFGSAEDLLLTVGIKDVDYTMDSEGSITVLPASNTDANSVPWKYIIQRPQVAFWPGVPDYAKAATDFEKVAIGVGVSDPTLGYASATLDSKGVPLFQALTDGITDVLAGRRPLTDFDQVVKDWQNNGGNTIRTELEQSIAAAKG